MKSALLVAAVAVIALLAGVATTGLPTTVVSDVALSEISTTDPTTAPTARPAPTISPLPLPTTVSSDDSFASSSTTTTMLDVTPTAAPTTLVPPVGLRVIVANAGGAGGVATRTADELRALGYQIVAATNANDLRPESIVTFAPGRAAEAARLASELGLSGGQVAPQSVDLVVGDDAADLVVLLGTDRP